MTWLEVLVVHGVMTSLFVPGGDRLSSQHFTNTTLLPDLHRDGESSVQ